MTASLEQTQRDLRRFLDVVRQGEEVLITDQGHPVARITGIGSATGAQDRQDWLAGLADLRRQIATGQPGATVEELMAEDRGD